MGKRFLLAAIGIVLLSGGVTALLALGEVDKLVTALGQSRAVKIAPKVLAPTSKGAPQTLLLVGNDQRPAPKGNPNGFVIPHSNEMLLVRIDPSKPTISMLSIPRELQVTIYPRGAAPVITRINAAYGIGGAELMTETIKRVLGVSVNHVFVLTFPKFRRAVDELGCVYMGVDRRYHHVNEPGGEQYFEINLQPGYQRLCGKEALEFVANRHEDTSLVRDARDQRFLLEVKAQYAASLFENRERFERILGRTVETDLHGSGQVLDLLELLLESEGKPVRQVPFSVNLLPTYDTASEQQIHESVRSFLKGTAAIRRPQVTSGAAHRAAHSRSHLGNSSGIALAPTTSSELAHARLQAPSLPFPLEYPRGRESFAGAAPDTLQLYHIRDQHGHNYPIYTVVIDRGQLGQFYDVQGTTWTDPPLLSNPGQTVRVGKREYELFYAGEQVRVIAWHEAGAVYWIENTLTNNVLPRTMLAMAEQTVPVIHTSTTPAGSVTSTVPANVDLARRSPAATSLITKVGTALAFPALAALALLALLATMRQRELRRLREQIAHALALEARQRPLLATSGMIRTQPTQVRSPRGPGVAAITSRSQPTRTLHRARTRASRGAILAAGAVLAAALIAVGILVAGVGPSTLRPSNRRSVSVAIFNATSTPGLAHRIASTLSASRVRVSEIGNIGASLGHGTFVLYPPRGQDEARAVARLLPNLTPTVEPIQPQVQEAVGRRDEIVVVLD